MEICSQAPSTEECDAKLQWDSSPTIGLERFTLSCALLLIENKQMENQWFYITNIVSHFRATKNQYLSGISTGLREMLRINNSQQFLMNM